MRPLPRIAVGTVQPGASREPMLWGLAAALSEVSASPVLFRSSCVPNCCDASRSIVGRASRHLDSWAMSRSDAIAALTRGAGERDLAIVEGVFDATQVQASQAGEMPTPRVESSLDRLCEWLDLPRLAVIDVAQLSKQGIALRPARLEGLLLDRVRDARDAAYWQTTLETLWKTPVVGWLDDAMPLRALCTQRPTPGHPSRELCHALGQRLLPSLRLDRLAQIARRATPLSFEPEAWLTRAAKHRFRIAAAIDEVYCGYYPETLDLLESAGAELCDFSPLRSEALPDATDIVYFGCGHPEREAERLAANHCLKQSLRCFAAMGGRIYAEGSGLAYLCRELILPGGRTAAMSGLLPATARWMEPQTMVEPAEITFGISSWLAPANVSVRGYRHNGWQIEPRGAMLTFATGANQRLDMLGRGNVIGSRVLINLAANRHLLRRYFEPYAPVSPSVRLID